MHFTTENEELLMMIVENFEGDELLRFNKLLIDEVENHKAKQLTLTDVGCSLPSKEERVAYAEEIVKKFGVTEIYKKETWLKAFHHGFRYAKSFISKR